jgi:predicted nucleotidyltransferase
MDNKYKIINYLWKHSDKSFTLLELSKETKIPYATLHRTIKQMAGLILLQAIGKAIVISPDKKCPTIKSYLAVSSEEEKKEYLQNQPIINKITSELDTEDAVVLFGSYAKNTQTENSDIDLLIINKNGKKDISFSKYELLYKKKINPIYITKKEFKDMIKDNEENVGKQTLKNHIILNNPEEFWGDVLDAIR